MGILDIGIHDISKLSEGDLQKLVGLLCEAELERHKLPLTGVVWTENTKARDGGVDIRVDTKPGIGECGFIPKGKTVFQVKQAKVPPSDIKREMRDKRCPKKLKDAIAKHFEAGGAYIIASGKDAVSAPDIDKREKAMRDLAPKNAYVAFYGSDHIARWVRRHASVSLRLRKNSGWLPYGDWSTPRRQHSGGCGYLVEDGVFLMNREAGRKLRITEGINAIRETVRKGNSAVRIVGLSGMGKTRLVQALFDSDIGEFPLNKHEAIYADSGAEIAPSPVVFARALVARKQPVVLVVDNCDRKKHNELADVCVGSQVKLITVELDIRDHLLEGTDVFQLECESQPMVEKLIKRRYPRIGQIAGKKIAKFCGGNPRMGLILAKSAERVDDLADLRDPDFLDRLLWQNNEADKGVRQIAEVCSLVYSFGVSGEYKEELEALAGLVGRTLTDVRHDVNTLVKRGIAQRRADMRAILPEALAHRLAANALEYIDCDEILRAVTGKERLFKSFSRRLGYLHKSRYAKKIAEQFIKPGGFLDVQGAHLNKLQMTVLENIAPALPEMTLGLIKRSADSGMLSVEFPHIKKYARLLYHLAYDDEMFGDAAELLSRLALLAPNHNVSEYARGILCHLFYYSLSGTCAPLEARLEFVKKLTETQQPEKWNLGLKLLSSTMTRRRENTWLLFDEFGARARGFGHSAGRDWFQAFISYAVKVAVSDLPAAAGAGKVLADHFRELWSFGLVAELDAAARKIAEHDKHQDMALAVLATIRFESDRMDEERRKRLLAIRDLFAPQNLREKFKMFFVTDNRHHLLSHTGLDGRDVTVDKVAEHARRMGVDIMHSKSDFKALLPDILTTPHHLLFQVGMGLAEGCGGDYLRVWNDFRGALSGIADPNKRFFAAPDGFMRVVAKEAIPVAVDILEKAVTDDMLAPVYPRLEAAAQLSDEHAIKRIERSVGLRKARAHAYKVFAWGRNHEIYGDADLARIIRSIMTLEGGVDAATEILSMRFLNTEGGQNDSDPAIIKCCREVAGSVDFAAWRNSGDMLYKLGNIVAAAFTQAEAADESRALCRKLAHAKIYQSEIRHILNPLARAHPCVFLDELVNSFDDDYFWDNNYLSSAIAAIKDGDDIIVRWCEQDPGERCHRAAFVVNFFEGAEGEKRRLTSIARRLIDKAPDKTKVLDNLWEGEISWSGWVGERVEMLEDRLALFVGLQKDNNPAVAEWARQRTDGTEKDIQWEKKRAKDDRPSPSRFEDD